MFFAPDDALGCVGSTYGSSNSPIWNFCASSGATSSSSLHSDSVALTHQFDKVLVAIGFGQFDVHTSANGQRGSFLAICAR